MCLIALLDCTITAYGAARNAGAELNPVLMAVWRSLINFHTPFQFVTLMILMYGIALTAIGLIILYATSPENNVGLYLSYGAAATHGALFSGVILLNIVTLSG